ncbi:hypothetical protein HSR121_3082 [Halapricum desulfuricans]|uniref:Uncharacterized protein n=1 Tax=Halapricum desulfuricans TaxID=2841257 RepID=A0A897N4I3_9EURY|nr:hypothetical protein HSR121_3082 [Halapricum desulfuricans]
MYRFTGTIARGSAVDPEGTHNGHSDTVGDDEAIGSWAFPE